MQLPEPHPVDHRLSLDHAVNALKAAAEPTRMRILLLLASAELNVKDLTRILGQSQPRLSRHLKLLVEAGLISRFREGNWVFFQLADHGSGFATAGMAPSMGLAASKGAGATTGAGPVPATSNDLGLNGGLNGGLDVGKAGPRWRLSDLIRAMVDPTDPELMRDAVRAAQVKREREAEAQAYFQRHAAEWDRTRSAFVNGGEVDRAMARALGPGPFPFFVDLGTGTGGVLAAMAERYTRGVGFDVNHSMLAYARSNLERAGITHAQVRHGDLYRLELGDACADVVVMHQVLHFLNDPGQALAEAARILKPRGHLLVVDFAPHDHEELREKLAHVRLGFSDEAIRELLHGVGIESNPCTVLAPPKNAKSPLVVSLWHGRKEAEAPLEASRLSSPRKPGSVEVLAATGLDAIPAEGAFEKALEGTAAAPPVFTEALQEDRS
ncbi:MAG: metalloregulator ArsR/SmtB family transcription factor [Pseudomonadota bacterium]